MDTKELNDLSSQKSPDSSETTLRNTAWIDYTVQNGDTLSKIFKANDLPLADLNALVSIEGEDKPLSHIKPGQLIRYKLTVKADLDILQVEQKDQSIMFFRLSDGGYGRSK
ncbi:LysM-like peptidoglycan-binding domain-containing protein [Vibrio sp. PP-XX7]